MSSNYGTKIKIQIFGQSHSDGIGVVIDGLPANEVINVEETQVFLNRRKGGQNSYSTKRCESDTPRILSGIVNGKTCGAPLCAIFENSDNKSKDYENLKNCPRPSHADYPALIKYNNANDIRGGGHFSGRLTLPLCFAGNVCMQILKRKGINIGAHIYSIGDIKDDNLNAISEENEILNSVKIKKFPVLNDNTGEKMIDLINKTRLVGDSIGGKIECKINGLPVGIGDPMFDGIENKLAQILFGIPAVKGVEFGSGFDCSLMYGSNHNDEYYYDNNGLIKTKTNNNGGIIGGISNGMPVIFKVAIKPTPSIMKQQNSVNLQTGNNVTLKINGRHDPCIVPRALPCIEAAAAIAILDLL